MRRNINKEKQRDNAQQCSIKVYWQKLEVWVLITDDKNIRKKVFFLGCRKRILSYTLRTFCIIYFIEQLF